MTIADPSSQPRWGYWLHHKTGHTYEIVGFGLQESTISPIVLYRRVDDTKIWSRPPEEFFDGRFQQITRL